MPDRVGQAVACTDITRVFDGGTGAALGPLSVTFRAGQTTALVGPSGCGKSTLLRLIAGLDTPSGGAIQIGDETPAQVQRRAGLAMAFQDASLLPWRSLRGNIALALTLARRSADRAQVDRLIHMVGLAGFENQRPAELSGGMRQRAAIARCLVGEPDLLLLDEPFGAVDELTRRRLGRDLPTLWQSRGTTAILVTHSVTEAVALSDRVLVLSPRPATVVTDIDVPLTRPRSEDEADFRELVQSVTAALQASAPDRPLAAQ